MVRKITKTMFPYAHQKVRKSDKELTKYYAFSVHPKYYNDFMNKEVIECQVGSSIIYTISGCKPFDGDVIMK